MGGIGRIGEIGEIGGIGGSGVICITEVLAAKKRENELLEPLILSFLKDSKA